MRLSVQDHDAITTTLQERGINVCYVKVLLNGEVAEGCIMADEEAGVIQRYATEPHPTKPGARRAKIVGDKILTEFLYGTVKIVLEPDAQGNWPHPGVPRSASDISAHLRF